MTKMSTICAMSACVGVAGLAVADSTTISLAGIESKDRLGSPINTRILENIGAGSTVVGLEWNNVVGNGMGGDTWGNEMAMAVLNSNGIGVSVNFFPSEGGSTAGGVWGPATGGSPTALIDDGLEFTADNGEITFEFYESYDDLQGTTDAIYESGTVTIYWESATPPVPGLGGMAVLAGAGLLGRRRR